MARDKPIGQVVLNIATPHSAVETIPSARTSVNQTAAFLYIPDAAGIDYHLLVVPGLPTRAVLIDCGGDPGLNVGTAVTELRNILRDALTGNHLDSVVISRAVPRRYNLIAAATEGMTIGSVHHASSPSAYTAPLQGGTSSFAEWLKTRKGYAFPSLYSNFKSPLLTLNGAQVYALGAHLDGGDRNQAAGASGSAVLLISYGGIRVLLTSDANIAASHTLEALARVHSTPEIFSKPAEIVVVTGRPDPGAGRVWPWAQGIVHRFDPPFTERDPGHARRISIEVLPSSTPRCGVVLSLAEYEATHGFVAATDREGR